MPGVISRGLRKPSSLKFNVTFYNIFVVLYIIIHPTLATRICYSVLEGTDALYQ